MEKKADFHSLSRKAKVQYVWDYYKWPIAAAIAALCFVIYLIYHYATYRDPLLNVIMMNCNDSITADSKGFDEFLEACGYDPKEDSVSLTSSLQFSTVSSNSFMPSFKFFTCASTSLQSALMSSRRSVSLKRSDIRRFFSSS